MATAVITLIDDSTGKLNISMEFDPPLEDGGPSKQSVMAHQTAILFFDWFYMNYGEYYEDPIFKGDETSH